MSGGSSDQRYVGRFAPSPTGPLHFGSLVAALASYADARAQGGQWLLRIEDVDETRRVHGAAEHILSTLRAYGFDWDGDVAVQSRRTSHYTQALAQLQSRGHVFACTCTRKRLETAPLTSNGERLYPGTCRARDPDTPLSVTHALRVRVDDAKIDWPDAHFGAQSQLLKSDVGDFVIRRADGLFAYQLAVVVDDAAQGVTHVVRGADLLSNTARQIYLQQLLGVPTPHYLHVPLIVNAAGEKLSKQTRAEALSLGDAILPTLARAWVTLGQTALPSDLGSPHDFLRAASAAWRVERLPRAAQVRYP